MSDIVFLNRDNTIDLLLVADGVPVAASSITRVLLTLGSTTIDSDDAGFGAGQAFDVTQTQNVRYLGTDYADQSILRLKLGGVSGLAAGEYTARLVTIDPDNTGGLVWSDSHPIEVRA